MLKWLEARTKHSNQFQVLPYEREIVKSLIELNHIEEVKVKQYVITLAGQEWIKNQGVT